MPNGLTDINAKATVGGGVPVRDITFVVRAAGERTLAAALATLRDQVLAAGGSEEQVRVVNERPFAAAVRRTLEIGAGAGRPWAVGMDADVLLTSRGVDHLRAMCAGAKPDTFTVTGLMLCKFYGGFVFRGVHVYRGALLERAVGLLGQRTPGGPDPELKPESAVVHAMAAVGHGYEGVPRVLAAHDFEQSFLHVYLKMRLRARREAAEGDVAGLTAFCRRAAERGDDDFRVALWGIEDGVRDGAAGRTGGYDWFARWPEFERRMDGHGPREKPSLAAGVGPGYADRAVAAHDWAGDDRTPRWVREALFGGREAA